MRTPQESPPDVNRQVDDKLVTQTRRYKVITPLFGGGVTPGEADPITVVRATEVRGHLRFWWRATRGGQFNRDLAKMKAAEEQIWGSAGGKGKAGPSEVSVIISDAEMGCDFKKVDILDVRSPYSYVAFPLRSERDKPAGKVRDGVEFTLTLQYPAHQSKDVLAALWAWETFGGIGARTRRGFGALQCIQIDGVAVSPSSAISIEDKIKNDFATHVIQGDWPDSVPHLYRTMKITQNDGRSADDAWKYLFQKLRKFRQARYGKKFGLSKWPEANEIRRLFNLDARLPEKESEARLVPSFPRAAFGLPIIFHMPHDSNISDDLTLDGIPDETSDKKYDRLASPLILRPLACADGKYVGLAVVLHAPTVPPKGLRLKGAPGDPQVKSELYQSEARQIDPLIDAPLLDGKTDVLQAFLNQL